MKNKINGGMGEDDSKLPEPKHLTEYTFEYIDGSNDQIKIDGLVSKKELIEEFVKKLDQWLQGSDEEGIEFIIRLRDEYEGRLEK